MTATNHVLMCRPEHYRIAYEINPWMRRSNAVRDEAARAQWQQLHDVLLGLGVRVDLVEQQPDVPDMVFTANAGIVSGRRFIPARFRHPERQPEAEWFARWFRDRGFEVAGFGDSEPWEGEGDVLAIDGRVFAASGLRTTPAALDRVESLLGAGLTRLELADPYFYHIDTCFFPLSRRCAAYYPPAFTPASRTRLEATVEDLIEVPRQEAERFACNALLVDSTVVMNDGSEETAAALEERGYRCVTIPTSEFIKAGGSVKCLVLTLDNFRQDGTTIE